MSALAHAALAVTTELSQNVSLVVLSQVLGWMYMIAWSVSFYPQIWVNFRAKSVVGLSFDYLTYNITGFVCYLVFNVVVYADPSIAAGTGTIVHTNDIAFAAHGVIALIVQFIQIALYERGGQVVSKSCWVISGCAWVSIVVAVFIHVFGWVSWLDVLGYLGSMKVASAFIKYAPQAYLNFRRKSTVGWSIWQVLLDLAGGLFSFTQMAVDGVRLASLSPVTGNIPKLLLSVVSFVFDVIFVFQHYVVYRERNEKIYTKVDSDEEVEAESGV